MSFVDPALVPLILRGYALTLVTFGLYRFWLMRDLRRWYREHTFVRGDRLEYLGTAWEHLRGFLIGAAIAAPLNVVFFFGTVIFGAFFGNYAILASGMALNYLMTYASYRAEQYRMARTGWRGLRFGLDGSAWRYANRMIGWQFVTLATLGLSYPWQSAASMRSRFSNFRYGSARGALTLSGKALFLPWIGFWISGLLLTALLVFLANFATTWIPSIPYLWDMPTEAKTAIVFGLGIAAFTMVWPAYSIVEWRMAVQNFRAGPMRFRAGISIKDVLPNYLIFAVILGGVLGLGLWIVTTTGAADSAPETTLSAGIYNMLILLLVSLVSSYIIGISTELLVNRVLWRVCLSCLQFSNLDALLETIEAVPDDATATGEGFLDALET